MSNRLFDWYRSTPLMPRRLIIAILVPVTEYILVEPCLRTLNQTRKINPDLAISLLFLAAAVTAAACRLFVIEMLPGVVNKIQNTVLLTVGYAGIFAWVILPFHVIGLFRR